VFDFHLIWDILNRIEYRDLLDILVVFIVVYELLKLVRGTQAVQMAFGIAILALLNQLANWLQLKTTETLLQNALAFAPLAVVVLFQGEIRTALTGLGRTLRNPLLLRARATAPRDNFDEVVLAATTLASRKIGALIVYERTVGLQNFIDTGVKLDAALTYDLLVTIFDPHTPLHDGAVIIRNDRVAAASCFLPLTITPRLSKELGTRHRAAIGITESRDCIAVVVSEETGTISLVSGGAITRHLNSARLREVLRESFEPPRPIAEVLPVNPVRRRRKRKRRMPDAETTAEMASELPDEVSMSEAGGDDTIAEDRKSTGVPERV
jgi:diadenylate cyclase